MLGVTAAFAGGGVLATQSRINGELGYRLGDGLLAALWSFSSGLVVMLVVLAWSPGVRRGLRHLLATVRSGIRHELAAERGRPARRLHWWQCVGGLCGAYLVTTQSATVGLLGVAVFTVAVVAGQAASSLVVDRLGVGPGGHQPVSPTRVVGATLALGAVLLTVSDDLGAPSVLLLAVLPALAGVGTAWQQAVNGRVAVVAGVLPPADPSTEDGTPTSRTPSGGGDAGRGLAGALVATLVNFAVGTTGLVVAAGIDIALRGLPHTPPASPVLYVGGLCGIIFTVVAASVVRTTGVLLLTLGAVAGQLVGALLLDGLLPTGAVTLTPFTVAGTILTMVAVTVAALPRRRPLPR